MDSRGCFLIKPLISTKEANAYTTPLAPITVESGLPIIHKIVPLNKKEYKNTLLEIVL